MTSSLISCLSRDRRSVQYCVRPVCIALRCKINRRWKRFQICYEKQSRGILQVDFKKNHPLDLLYADRRMGADPLSSGLQAPPEYASSMAYDRREGVSVGTACPPGAERLLSRSVRCPIFFGFGLFTNYFIRESEPDNRVPAFTIKSFGPSKSGLCRSFPSCCWPDAARKRKISPNGRRSVFPTRRPWTRACRKSH